MVRPIVNVGTFGLTCIKAGLRMKTLCFFTR